MIGVGWVIWLVGQSASQSSLLNFSISSVNYSNVSHNIAIIHVLGAADSDLTDVILCSDDRLYVKVDEGRNCNRYRVRVRRSNGKVRHSNMYVEHVPIGFFVT